MALFREFPAAYRRCGAVLFCSQARPAQKGGGFAQASFAGPVPGPGPTAEFRDRELHCCGEGVVRNVVSPNTLPLLQLCLS